jgi:hypothetical protein
MIWECRPVTLVITVGLSILQSVWTPASVLPDRPEIVWAAAVSQTEHKSDSGHNETRELSPEEKMNRRFPQPVRVGDLIGLPVLDDKDSTIGYIQQVVRTPAGKIQLVVPYGRWFGWVRLGGPFEWNRRLVGVPLEVVAILGRQVAALDMPREDFDKAPEFTLGASIPLGPDEMIKIALGRR